MDQQRIDKPAALIELAFIDGAELVLGAVDGRGVESCGENQSRNMHFEERVMIRARGFEQGVDGAEMSRIAQGVDAHAAIQTKGVFHQPARRLALLVLHDGDDFSRGAGHIGGDHQTDVADLFVGVDEILRTIKTHLFAAEG
ncbi:MAG: hypothetical protein BWY83_02886 [bacterium ADurb.Bin478]|nr:MAG: hypothetical protein BWY83_02886 [bacterium ADurb.Bin478]